MVPAVTAGLVAPEQTDGCVVEGSMTGLVALVERGRCSFLHKVEQAQVRRPGLGFTG